MHKKRIFKFFRSALCAALAVSMIFGEIGSSLGIAYAKEAIETQTVESMNAEAEMVVEEADTNALADDLAERTEDGVILHAFCWSFNTIKENMKDIAEAGYTTVQTSPANACNDSHPQMVLYDKSKGTDYDGANGCWWWHYQPTDWTIGNYQLGTKEDYAAMCQEADKYGVKIITDVIPNHTTPDLARVSSSLAATGGGLGAGQLYHANGFNGINNWGDRHECTTGMMGGLPDVNTENQAFQEYYLKYCNDLIDIGCDGFRYDTAKHIGVPSDPTDAANTRKVNDFWDVATGKKAVNGTSLKNKDNVFIYGEVLQGDNVPTEEYAGYMYQTASSYGHVLREAIGSKNFSTGKISNWCHTNPERVVSWVESHDTYCNGHESAWMSDWDIKMCWAIIGARKDGVPLFMSRPDGSDGSSKNYWGNNVLGAKGNDHFKDPEIVAVNKFRTAMSGEGEYLRNPNGSQEILQIDRGTKGTCIINLGGSTSINNETSMADGTYTDQVSGREFTVSGGKISGQLDGGKVAVIYNADVKKTPKITSSVATGKTFTDTLEVTISVTNADSASYTLNGGASESFTGSKTITLGESDDYGTTYTINVTASNADGEAAQTYTYTKTEPKKVKKNTVYFTKPSGWGTPNVYAYAEGATATEFAGKWPGTAMTDEGNGVYSYTFADSVTSCGIIFNDGNNQDPAKDKGNYAYTAGKAFSYENGNWEEIEVVTATATPKVTATPKPTNTPNPTNTPIPSGPNVTASMKDGASFDTETATVKLTLNNAEKGTYSVDDGPVKEFTGSADVVIGKGKIADSDVTVKVTATGEGKTTEKTFTYKKNYVPDVAAAPENAVETVVEEAEVNASAETGGYYATNPNSGVGKEATITSMNDFTADMLVAQCGAWDVPNAWKGGHENSVADCYGLYAAWDDDNLYVGLEMVNTTDTWANEGDGPLSDGGKIVDVPIVLALHVGNKNLLTGESEDGKGIWQMNLQFETPVDHLFVGSAKGTGTPGLFLAKDNGLASYDKEYCLSYAENGISYTLTDGSISSKIMHLHGSKDVADAYDVSKYEDALAPESGSKTHNRKYDSFYIYTIPLKVLGIDKSFLTSNGVGIMGIGTRQSSALDCIPHDPSMLDNTMENYSADSSTSKEKEDLDIISVPLASVGKLRDPNVVVTVPPTKPTVTPVPTQAEATATPVPTQVTATPVPTEIPADVLHVNFGADRSAPQYTTTALSVKAIAAGGEAPYNYEFFVDGTSVQNSSSDTYAWQNGKAGERTIKVVVTDAKGKTVSSEKDYDLESNGVVDVTAIPTPTVVATATPVPTKEPEVTPEITSPPATSLLRIKKFAVSCKTADGKYKVGDEFIMRAETTGAEGTAQYMFTYILNGEEVIVKNYGPESEASFIADTPGAYGFKVYVVDNGNDYSPEFETGEIVVQEKPEPTPLPTQEPGTTAIPTPTGQPEVTDKPEVTETPIITGEPVATATPVPTKVVTKAPLPTKIVKPTNTATPTPTKKPVAPTATAKPKPTQAGSVYVEPGTIIVDDTTESDYTVISSGSTKTVEFTQYCGSKTRFTVPDAVKVGNVTYKVTSISDKAFENNKKLKSVTIGKNVTKIGKSAFAGCTSLQSVKGGKNVKTIGDKAFYNCKKLISVTLSSKLTTIGKSAFYKCTSLKKITIPSKVNKIGSKAFYGCKKLKTITIKSKKLTSGNVGKQAFKGIYSKATIKVPKSKLGAYKKLLKSKGVSAKAKIKK